MIIVTSSFSKYFSSTLKRQTQRFQIPPVEVHFQKAPFSCWISVDGRPNRRNKAAFS